MMAKYKIGELTEVCFFCIFCFVVVFLTNLPCFSNLQEDKKKTKKIDVSTFEHCWSI